MSPFGIETLPAEALRALRTLPLIAERLEEVAVHTSVLERVEQDVTRIAGGVAAMEGRVATIEAAMPDLVAAIATLGASVAALQESMEPVGRLADKLPGGSRR